MKLVLLVLLVVAGVVATAWSHTLDIQLTLDPAPDQDLSPNERVLLATYEPAHDIYFVTSHPRFDILSGLHWMEHRLEKKYLLEGKNGSYHARIPSTAGALGLYQLQSIQGHGPMFNVQIQKSDSRGSPFSRFLKGEKSKRVLDLRGPTVLVDQGLKVDPDIRSIKVTREAFPGRVPYFNEAGLERLGWVWDRDQPPLSNFYRDPVSGAKIVERWPPKVLVEGGKTFSLPLSISPSPSNPAGELEVVFTGDLMAGEILQEKLISKDEWETLKHKSIKGGLTWRLEPSAEEPRSIQLSMGENFPKGTLLLAFVVPNQHLYGICHCFVSPVLKVNAAPSRYAAPPPETIVPEKNPPAEPCREADLQIARQAIVGKMEVPPDVIPVCETKGSQVMVTFPMKNEPGVRGPDYYAQVIIDRASGRVIRVLGAS